MNLQSLFKWASRIPERIESFQTIRFFERRKELASKGILLSAFPNCNVMEPISKQDAATVISDCEYVLSIMRNKGRPAAPSA